MGVSGVGKTTVGRMLAERLGWSFFDADDFHPPANVTKMRQGMPLTDDDREEWLDRLNELIRSSSEEDEPAILACSALKQRYRSKLSHGLSGKDAVVFVYLRAPREVVAGRLGDRSDHFFNPDLLDSQIAALEEPDDAVVVDASAPLDEIMKEIEDALE